MSRLAEDLALARLGGKPVKVGWAAEKLGHECWTPLLERLAADGAVRAQDGLLRTRRWPAADSTREQAVRAGIAAALGGADPDAETTALITILHGIGAVPGSGDAAGKARAAEIATAGWSAGPLRDAFHGLDTVRLLLLAVS